MIIIVVSQFAIFGKVFAYNTLQSLDYVYRFS